MSNSTASIRRSAPALGEVAEAADEPTSAAPWLTVVSDKVKSMRFGVVQIVIHDSKVVQIERTERTRFDVPQPAGRR
ncbi:MAG: YezD family protein [Chthoniobacter sp.]|uniref:YezD family protein n=1 Tax=Chthoniobacter sp. TaxID=2510640 RepID=UPI0032AA215D